jgi:protein associated with RNAse G/E
MCVVARLMIRWLTNSMIENGFVNYVNLSTPLYTYIDIEQMLKYQIYHIMLYVYEAVNIRR